MKKLLLAVLSSMLAFTGLTLTGCKSNADALNGKWETQSLVKDGESKNVAASFIEFEVKGNKIQVHGEAGVNTFAGEIKADSSAFSAGNVAVTKMMGDPVAMEFEDLFLEVLSTAESWKVEGDVLTLTSASKNMSVSFKKAD